MPLTLGNNHKNTHTLLYSSAVVDHGGEMKDVLCSVGVGAVTISDHGPSWYLRGGFVETGTEAPPAEPTPAAP